MTRKAKILLSIFGGVIALGCFSEYAFSDTEASQYPREYQFTDDQAHRYGMHALHEEQVHKHHMEHVKHLRQYERSVEHRAKTLDIKRLHQIGNQHCRGANRTYGYIKYPKYGHNYWSFYNTHHVPMFYKEHQHLSLNRDVLRKHNVTSGINFEDTNYTSANNNTNYIQGPQGSSENQQ